MPILYNNSNAAIELDDFGVTVPSGGTSDISHIRQQVIANSTTLLAYVANSVIEVVNNTDSPSDYWSVTDALSILTLGVNGAQVGISKPTRPGIVTGNFYGPSTDDPLVSAPIMNSVMYAIPVDYMGTEFNRIGIAISNSIANSEIHLGVYANNEGLPGALLLDAGIVPSNSIGNNEIVIDFTTPTDWCFLCLWASDPVSTLTLQSSAGVFGNSSNSISTATRVYYSTETYTSNTALSDPFPNSAIIASSDYPPFVWFRSV